MRKRYCVDKGFKSLIPPLSEAERSQLEESCIKYGIKDSIKIWKHTIVDGHNRYEIAQKHNLRFRVNEMDFNARIRMAELGGKSSLRKLRTMTKQSKYKDRLDQISVEIQTIIYKASKGKSGTNSRKP